MIFFKILSEIGGVGGVSGGGFDKRVSSEKKKSKKPREK